MNNGSTLRTTLDRLAVRGELFSPLERSWVLCYACGHRCRIPPGRYGICKVRENRDGVLFVPSGYAAGIALDPIEKKPFFHALPGSTALSFGMMGCDYHCAYCQNWVTSQALRDPAAGSTVEPVSSDRIVQTAVALGAAVVTSTYNEPLITSEWAVEVFRKARAAGLKTSFVSNGNGTLEVLEYLRPHLDLYKVDLKSFRAETYRRLGGTLDTVLETIRSLHRMGVWLEVVTLIVPGLNDSDDEVRGIAEFLGSVSPDIPWHVTAFHSDYRMSDTDRTTAGALIRAAGMGRAVGLRFVYAGNLPGMTDGNEDTRCPTCRTVLIRRIGFRVIDSIIEEGQCPECRTAIPGVWA
jgi:pyruvate formate lyase activating enzyme